MEHSLQTPRGTERFLRYDVGLTLFTREVEMEKGTARWVSVEERLPSGDGNYNVFLRGDIEMLGFDRLNRMWLRDGNIDIPSRFVTHWLEVCPPEVPKVKVKKEGWVMPQEIHDEGVFCHKSDCIKVTYEE